MDDQVGRISAVARHQERTLFDSYDLPNALQSIEQQMLEQLDELSDERVLAQDPGDLANEIAAPWRVGVPRLLEDQIEVAEPPSPEKSVFDLLRRTYEDRGKEKGPTVEVRVPFDGHEGVFGWGGEEFKSKRPAATIRHSQLILTYTFDHDDDGQVGEQLRADLAEIEHCLTVITERVAPFNDALVSKALQRLEDRRARLRRDSEMIASLGYPLRRRDNSPNTYSVPMKRRVPVRRQEGPGQRPEALEPELALAEYDYILKVISNMALVLERSPQAFRTLGEEDLRTHFLVQLNGQYDGQATGETFNYEGKTDILVRVEGRNIFVAECKFWSGPKALGQTVDQLLGYTTWRDAKAAILVFNKNRNLSQVLAAIPEQMRSHPKSLRALDYPSETGFRYVFQHRDDAQREMTITVLVFDVPA
jgi:hypothetical protein